MGCIGQIIGLLCKALTCVWKFAEQVYGTVDFMPFAHGRQVGDGILKK